MSRNPLWRQWRLQRRILSMPEIVNRIPNNGCIIFFNANRKSVQARVSSLGLSEYLEVHKISEEPRSREKVNQPCDVYIGWRDAK